MHIGGIELEPFPARPLRREAIMPITLDTGRIIRWNHVDRARLVRQFSSQLVFSAPDCIGPANLEATSGFEKVDAPDFYRLGLLMGNYMLDRNAFG